MILRWKLCLAIMLATSTLVVSGPAAAQELNCDDFNSQAEAQDFFREVPSDPEGLDGPPGDASTGIRGVACEDNPPPTDFDPVLPAGVGVPNGVPKGEPKGAVPKGESPVGEPPDSELPNREPPDRQPPDREPPDNGKELLEAGGDLSSPQQSATDNYSGDDSRFPLWRVAGMIASAGLFLWAGYRVVSRG
jgi:hypothetical protein